MRLRLPRTKERLRREAADWLARLQSGRDPQIQEKFRRWHDSDPANAAAFARVRRSYEQAGLLRQVPAEPANANVTEGRRHVPALAIAACVLAVVVPAGVLVGWPPFGAGRTEAVMLVTKVGETRHVALSDGSKVTLDTASSLQVEVGKARRSARLSQGRARFEIVKGAQPFVIEAGTATVTAREATLDVERRNEQSSIILIAGTAAVHPSNPSGATDQKLGRGEQAVVDPDGQIRTARASPAREWTRGMLQFEGTPLAEVAVRANSYSRRHILVDPRLRSLRVTGAYRAGDIDGLATALAAAFHLSLSRSAGGNLILAPNEAIPPQKKKGG